jgi:DNA-binding MarR family transcriptional regulator
MKDLLDQLVWHLDATLGITVSPLPWDDASRLPFFLRNRYEFFEAGLLGAPCLFMIDKDEHGEPPATIRKHIDQVRTKWEGAVVYVRHRVTAYNRKRLIEQKVAFVVPGNQMYLPMLGIDLRERFRKRKADHHTFRPSSQAVLIHMLLCDGEDFGSTELTPTLGYSAMTISRALDELEASGLVESSSSGRERRLRLTAPKPDVWKNAQPFLRNPVQSRHWVRIAGCQNLPGLRAGLTALAHDSILAEPRNVVVAVSRADWNLLQQRGALTAALKATTSKTSWPTSSKRTLLGARLLFSQTLKSLTEVRRSGAFTQSEGKHVDEVASLGSDLLDEWQAGEEQEHSTSEVAARCIDVIVKLMAAAAVAQTRAIPAMADEPGALHVEVWSYPPTLFARDGLVDPLSLYLSLRDTEDERVESALDQMMGDVSW